MKKIFFTSLFTFVSFIAFSQSPPVAVDDYATGGLEEFITINVTANDYHPDGLTFRIKNAWAYSYTDSTIRYKLDYDTFYNKSGSQRFSYILEDENGLIGFGNVYLNLSNNFYDTLDLNNINAIITPYGNQFWRGPGYTNWYNNPDTSLHYEFPNGSEKGTIFNSTFWIGGMDQEGELRLSAERYRNSGIDFWTGPLSIEGNNLTIDTSTVVDWNRLWKLNKNEVEYHKFNWNKPNYEPITNILTWPAHGDSELHQSQYLAPFIDVDGDGIYNPYIGDYPLIKGDQCVFYIFNDVRDNNNSTEGNNIGLEIHGMMYQFDEPNNLAFNNTVFLNYKIFNHSEYTLTDTYIGIWTDTDLGYPQDDYMGCDVERGMYFSYNSEEIDGNGEPQAYGENPPAQGILFLGGPHLDPNNADDLMGGCDESINGVGFGDSIIDNERYGMTGFLYHDNANNAQGDPEEAQHYYDYMKGIWKDGTEMLYNNTGYLTGGVYGPSCRFMYPGYSDSCMWGTDGIQPYGIVNWCEETAYNGDPYPPNDRRGLGSMGPFTFMPGTVQEIDIAYVTARGDNGPLSSVELLKIYADTIRARYIKNSNDFGTQYLDIKEWNKNYLQLKIFPNPANDIINVEYDRNGRNANYMISDIYGRKVLSGAVKSGNKFTIDISILKSGVYIISVVDDEHRYGARMIKR